MDETYQYTREDFLTSRPYEEVLTYQDDPFRYEVEVENMAAYAKSLKFTAFRKMLKTYIEAEAQRKKEFLVKNATAFTDQPIELDAGEWEADDLGVRKFNGYSKEWACPHPILPVERLVNIDTGEEKLTLAFRKGRAWRRIIVDKGVLAAKNKVTDLAKSGIAVTSNSSGAFVTYISDLENINYDRIPEHKCVTRCGYITGEGFSPFVDDLVFDGDAGYRPVFEAIRSHGSREKSIRVLQECRDMSLTARIVIAAAFASVLVAPLGALPFFVHLWGVDSGTGKTVGLMAAASVWGDPKVGSYIKTFNSTVVGYEKMAAFLNHLPLMLDELQLTKSSKGQTNFDVYQLAQGTGRTRGNAAGGVDRTATWANCILTTGESPIVGVSAGAGAVNRVLDVECRADSVVIRDGVRVSNELKRNYGFLGREFVAKLYDEEESNLETASSLYHLFFQELSERDTTEKQAMAAAILLTADTLIGSWLFRDKKALTVEQISDFLATKASVSLGDRGYRYMCDWVSQNANRLCGSSDVVEVLGVIDGDTACIVSSCFKRVAEDAGFPAQSLLSYLKSKKLISTGSKGYTRSKRINGISTACVWLKLPNQDDEIVESDEEDPLNV